MDYKFPSFILVPQKKVPVITYDNIAGSIRKVVADAINLLRSGHPAVQIIVEYPDRLNIEDRSILGDKFSEAAESLSIIEDQRMPGMKTEVYAAKYSDKDIPVLEVGGNFIIVIHEL